MLLSVCHDIWYLKQYLVLDRAFKFLYCVINTIALSCTDGIYDNARKHRMKDSRAFFYPSTDVFIITTSDSLSMFIYSQKHVQLPYFHHVMLVFHRRIRREALSESSSPEGMFILDAALLALELMTFIMPCWRAEHECLVSWKNHAIFLSACNLS